MPPQPEEIHIEAELATNKYLTLTHSGTTTIDIDEATTTKDAATITGDEAEDQHDSDHEHVEDQTTTGHDNTYAQCSMPGKRRRVTTSARWENNALRQFKRRFDDDAEREESLAWERERTPARRIRQRRTSNSRSNTRTGVTRV